MEVLYDVRPGRRVDAPRTLRGAGIARAAVLAVLAALLGCTSERKRELPSADTAVANSARDTIGAAGASGTATDSVRDSAVASRSRDSLPGGAAPGGAQKMLLVVTVGDSAAGDALYRGAGTCQTCHGARGEGVAGLGPPLNDTLWLHGDGSPGFIQRVTLEGIAVPKESARGMPAFADRLPTADAYRIAAYVYTLSHPRATVTHPFGSVPARDTGAVP